MKKVLILLVAIFLLTSCTIEEEECNCVEERWTYTYATSVTTMQTYNAGSDCNDDGLVEGYDDGVIGYTSVTTCY